ncbi:MAG TPA: malate dehydrogenase [Planctomycetota bacterium]|nr:malate dehydrogenase [Planctomycetota bacterium]
MAKPKVAVFGAGHVGATVAQRVVEKELADVVLLDVVEGLPQGKALDMAEAAPVEGYDAHIAGSNNTTDVAGADLVVITAGIARKPGMSRDDLLATNAKIVGGIADAVRQHAPDAIVVVVTNPLDVMTWLVFERTGFPPERVMGMAGVLDSARFRTFIAMELGVSVKDVEAMVLGGHGDSMVPLPRYATVGGVPLGALLPQERIEALIQRTRNGGAEIVALLKTGSAYYAPASAAVAMVGSILRDERRVLPACVRLDGQYGLTDVFAGVPVVLGDGGVEMVVELELTPDELKALQASADEVRATYGRLKTL